MRFFSRVFLPLLLLGYIAVETYFKLQHTSLCDARGCKLAGELVNFDSLYLNYLGIAGLFLLTMLGYLSLKSRTYSALFFMGLYSAIAFEATIISYQYVANPEPCLFCLTIIGSLLLIAMVARIKHFPAVLGGVIAIFLGLNILAVSKNRAFIQTDGAFLIQSSTCPHCTKVKTYMAEHEIEYTPISVKEASARNFLKFTNIQTIPVLIIKKASHTQMITGDQDIITYFQENSVATPQTVQTPTLSTSTLESMTPDFLGNGGHDEGCAVSILETPSCSDEGNTTKEK